MVRRRKFLATLVHTIRVLVIAALLLLIPPPHTNRPSASQLGTPPDIELIRRLLPKAADVAAEADLGGFWAVHDDSGSLIARAARTLPEAADVIGYRGPSEALVLLDQDLNLIGVDLIDSADTDEHVQAVKRDTSFFGQFQSWTWQGPESNAEIDAVSGATLTSLALAKGVLKRIGGDRPSLVFPDEVAVDEISDWFPAAVATRAEKDRVVVLDPSDNVLGNVIRTGPLCDNIVGYQGPTELLIRLETQSQSDSAIASVAHPSAPTIAKIKLRSSFDNQPYVRYCKTEYGFWALFTGKSIAELAGMDLQAEAVEGVSGATMTSLAVAETLVAAANEFQQRATARTAAADKETTTWDQLTKQLSSLADIKPSAADWGCVGILCLIPLLRAKGWFRSKRRRAAWLLAVTVVIGLWSGNLISLALVAGWSSGGVAWRLAPALAAILVVAFVSPVLAKSNPYCNHLCPHGAIQQLIRPRRHSKRHWTPPARLSVTLKYLPGSMLVVAYLLLIWLPTTDLSAWEPFHAYLFRIAPWSAIGLAAATIVFSAFVPMGYCRLGCPTGRLLDHLRRSAGSDRLQLADAIAFALLLLAIGSVTLR